jgi:hypothetical protein
MNGISRCARSPSAADSVRAAATNQRPEGQALRAVYPAPARRTHEDDADGDALPAKQSRPPSRGCPPRHKSTCSGVWAITGHPAETSSDPPKPAAYWPHAESVARPAGCRGQDPRAGVNLVWRVGRNGRVSSVIRHARSHESPACRGDSGYNWGDPAGLRVAQPAPGSHSRQLDGVSRRRRSGQIGARLA